MELAPAFAVNITADVDPATISTVASQLSTARLLDFGKDDPSSIGCLPMGPRSMGRGGLTKVIQTPTLIVLLYEDLSYRQIHLDGRSLQRDPSPAFMGYSVGRWDGDTLVVESNGYNDRAWLDFGGHPHTEQLKTVERGCSLGSRCRQAIGNGGYRPRRVDHGVQRDQKHRAAHRPEQQGQGQGKQQSDPAANARDNSGDEAKGHAEKQPWHETGIEQGPQRI